MELLNCYLQKGGVEGLGSELLLIHVGDGSSSGEGELDAGKVYLTGFCQEPISSQTVWRLIFFFLGFQVVDSQIK